MHQNVSIWCTGNDVMLPLIISYRYLYLLVGLDNDDVAHNLNPDMCCLTKFKWLKI